MKKKSLMDEIISVLPSSLQSAFKDEVDRRNRGVQTEEAVVPENTDIPRDVPSSQGRIAPPVNWEEAPTKGEAVIPDTQITMPLNIPPPVEQEVELFPETQELADVTDKMQKEASNLQGTVAQAKQPLPTNPMEVDLSSLTPADFEAAMQLMRGEPPTANLQQHLNAEALRNFG